MSPSTVKRPGSVTFVIVLTWISALLSILAGVLFLISAGDTAVTDELGVTQGEVTTVGVVTLAFGLITALVAASLSGGSRFARFLVSLVMVLRIAAAAYALVVLGEAALWSAIASILFAVLILALLWNRRASEFFHSR